MISTVISAIPQAGKRGVDTRDVFVTKQEAFQDALYLTTVGQLNAFAQQVNDTVTDINDILVPIEPIFTNIDAIVATGNSVESIEIVSDNITNVNTVGNSIANVNTVGTNITKVNAVGTNITKVNAVGNSIDNVNAVGSDMSAVVTVATAIQGGTLPTIIDDTTTSSVATWSSSKIDAAIQGGTVATIIDDTTTSSVATWSSSKINTAKQDTLVSGTSIKTINGNSIVGSGNISTIQTSVSGNAGTATKLETLRSIAISGDASGSGNFDGSANANIAITLNSNVTREGNTFNGISQLVKTGTDGKLPAIDGSQLIGIDALPNQTGFNGKYLKTNGTVATWEVSDVYTHPANHSPSIITQDSNNRFVSDTEKASWNQKQDPLTLKTINNNSILGSGNLDIGGTPAGTIITFASATAPTGYLKANGALLSRTTYSALFAAIGTTFGVGDGSTTFALPDLRGYFPRGWDDGRGIDTSRVFGSNQGDGYLNHSHTASETSEGAHTHTIAVKTGDANTVNTAGNGNLSSPNGSVTTSSSGAHTHTITVSTSTTGTTETRPKNIALLYCIKY